MANWVHGALLKYRGAETPAERKTAGKELLAATGGIMANAVVSALVTAGLAKLRRGTDVEDDEDKAAKQRLGEFATLGGDVFNALLPGSGIPFMAAAKLATQGQVESPDMFSRVYNDLGRSSKQLITAIFSDDFDPSAPKYQRAMLKLADAASQLGGLPVVSSTVDMAKIGAGVATGEPLIAPTEKSGGRAGAGHHLPNPYRPQRPVLRRSAMPEPVER